MSSSSQTPSRKNRGRQKVNMVKMANQNNLQVTFSKRRAGLFKKASELCTLCGSEAAIVVFSPTDKAYSFGHPNVETLINRYLNGMAPATHNTINQLIMDAHRDSNIRNLNLELTQVETMLAIEKRRGEELDLLKKGDRLQRWISTEMEGDEFSYEQLSAMKDAALNIKKSLDGEMQKSMHGVANSPPSNPTHENGENFTGFPFGVGSSSVSHVPAFGNPSSLGLNAFPPYAAAGTSGSQLHAQGRIEYEPVDEHSRGKDRV